MAAGGRKWRQAPGGTVDDRQEKTYSANFHLSFPPLLLLLAFPLLLGPKKEILYNTTETLL